MSRSELQVRDVVENGMAYELICYSHDILMR